MEIIGNVKNYEWGKLGRQSFVAQLAQANNPQLKVEDESPYAELWMGDHVNGPATVKSDSKGLDEVIQADPHGMIGTADGRLPFLLKVLSIRKALSVQVHPDKVEAEKLHRQFPDIYKDPNHKPELAIALTEFQALCGFRPYAEIDGFLQENPELQELLGPNVLTKFQAKDESAVKFAYERLMHSAPDDVKRCIDGIAKRMVGFEKTSKEMDHLFMRLYADFGQDVGVLSIYFLNYLQLNPGQAIYLAANVPHAYLDGDCVECMACSDNVVRAGLTPKFKDVDTLLRLVSYDCLPGESMLFQPKVLHPKDEPYTRTFVPPVPDFAVAELRLPTDVREYSVSNPINGSILLVINGKGKLKVAESEIEMSMGKIIFLPSSAGRKLQLKVEDANEPFLAFQAMSNQFE
ncbi:mannose-6-phosphate isomerase [Anopheles moucheti]|uniref:mannose-6-phosphate isomerase n=1 Tax=Anopheles moucheti TaxID=186751 RepID=UPI0022F0D4A7|nr:mannose-6-phosphate isomerase [Anopheles moucheti]